MTSYTFRLDSQLKQQSFEVFKNYGLNPAQAIKMFLRQVAETNTIPVSLNYEAKEPQFNYDLARMKERVEGEFIALPAHIKTAEEIKDWLING